MRRFFIFAGLLALACGKPEDSDSPEPIDDTPPQPTGCELLEVGFSGNDPPVVGDMWTVWPICDGSPVIGAAVIRVDPVECCKVYDNEITFEDDGDLEIMVQSGSQRAYLDVSVGAP